MTNDSPTLLRPQVVRLLTLPDDLDSLEWEEHSSHGRQGARIHLLYQCPEKGQKVALVHCRPGTTAKSHRHEGHESIYVIQGSFQDDFGIYSAGDLVVYPDGSEHGWCSPEGGVMYVVWGAPVHSVSY